ncbi:MAG: Crp/Fnr family transcriptional regulator [Amphritea sp.]
MSQPVTDCAIELARKNILFHTLEEDVFNWLMTRARLQRLEKGDALFSQRESADRFYLVVNGRIKLFHLSIDGQEKVVEVIGEGDTFAEAVMFMEAPNYPVHAEALGSAQVVVFNNRDYKAILQDSSESCFKLLANMARRLHLRLSEIETLTVQNARHRVVRFLLGQLEQTKGSVVELPMAKRLVASRLAMQPETFSRVIHDLKEQGVLDVQGRKLHVRDVNALRSFT